MATKKLTLSADEQVVQKARELARRDKTSISSLFRRFILAAARRQGKESSEPLAPLTRKALGLAKLPPRRSDRELLEEALAQKHGHRS